MYIPSASRENKSINAGLSRDKPHGLYEGAHLLMVFLAWTGLDAAADVDPVGADLLNGLRDVLRRQPARQ
jgi:hypothetical protein